MSLPIAPIWFYATVEDINDPDQRGRVAIRIRGIHDPDPAILAVEYLPWAQVMMPATDASYKGMGNAPTGIVVGTEVMGFALDEAYQQVRICWTWHGVETTGGDVNPLAVGQLTTSIERKNYNAVKDVSVKQEDPENPTPVPPDTDIDPQKWMTIANNEIGVREYAGRFNNNPRILEYNKATSLGASEDEVSWCASFVGWVLLQAGYTPTRSALARSYLNWGAPLPGPRFGAVVVFRRGSNPVQGHVSFVQKFDDNFVWCLGGNQSDSVKVSRFSRNTVLGYRWPEAVNAIAAAPVVENGKWSEPIVSREPTPIATPAPSGKIVDEDNTGTTTAAGGGSSVYPNNHVYTSWSGHIVEVDDSPNQERLHWFHRSGSYKEMLSDGDVVNKSVKDHYDITSFDKRVYIGKNNNITIVGYEVKRNVSDVYHVNGASYSNVTFGTWYQKFGGVGEIHYTDILRLIGKILEVAGQIKVPILYADQIFCNALSVKAVIDGSAAYANTAGVAGSLGGATPVAGQGAGEIKIESTLEDNGGNF